MLPEVLAQIAESAQNVGRPQGSVKLIAVTKGQSEEAIQRCIISHGNFPLAEGRAQALRDKMLALPEQEWHFIGPFQINKVKYFKDVALIHSLEAVWQAEAIARHATSWGKAPAVLIQVHNGEEQKHGVPKKQLADMLKTVRQIGLSVSGLMVMAPYDRPQLSKQIFEETQMRAHDLGLSELSMGMSDDFEIAIQAGSTMVRVGRRLFNENVI